MTINERIKEIRHLLRTTQPELARKIGVKTSRIESLEKGIVKSFKPEEVEALVKLGFRREWLITGEGYPEDNDNPNAIFRVIRSSEADKAALNHRPDVNKNVIRVEYFDYLRVSAGYGLEVFDETPDGVDEFPARFFNGLKNLKNIKCLRVSGDSMYPRFSDGDYVFVDVSPQGIRVEGIYVIRIDNTLLVKKVQWLPNGLKLISENKEYDPVILNEHTYNPENVGVIGKVVLILSKP